jgi:hypothetical protein
MRNIGNILKVDPKEGHIGVEIEVEGANLPRGTNHWRKDNDPSLRGNENAEYVLKNPVKVQDLNAVFKELQDAFDKNNSVIDSTYRAGVHTHINVQDLTITQLFNLITLFLIMEDCFVDFCEPSRRGNHFCLRAKDAGYFTHTLWQACKEGNLKKLDTEDIRYSAMNVTSVFRYGSLEFRSLESTKDFGKIKQWCLMLYQLKLAALQFKSPIDIMDSVSAGGYENFAKFIMGEWFPIINAQSGWQKKVREGILNAQDLAYSRKWVNVNLNIFKKEAVFG